MLEDLIQDAIDKEERIDIDDCTFYAIKDNKGNIHFAAYNENYVLTMVHGTYKLMIRYPEEVKINLTGHPREYKEAVEKMSKRKADYRSTLKFVGAENIEIPGKFGEIFNYLRSKYPIEISGAKNIDPSLKKVKRVYDEIKMVKDLKNKGLNYLSITREVYEKFTDEGISKEDFNDYKFYTLSNYIIGINYLNKHPDLEKTIKELKGKVDDREIAKKIYTEKNWVELKFALTFLRENTLSNYIQGINYLNKHPDLEKTIKELKGKVDDREIAEKIYTKKNYGELGFALRFLGEITLGDYIIGINYLNKHPDLEKTIKELKGKLDDREIAKKIYDEKNYSGLMFALTFLRENTLSQYIQGINYLNKHPDLEKTIKELKGKLDDREIAKKIYDEKNYSGLGFALKFLGENTLSGYIHGINYLNKHPNLEKTIKELKGKVDDREIAEKIYTEKNYVELEFTLMFLGENTLSSYIQGINYLNKHPDLEKTIKELKGKVDDREIAKKIYTEKNWVGLGFALKFLEENILSSYIQGINYLNKHPDLEKTIKELKGKLDDREIAKKIYTEKNYVELEFALKFLGENSIAYQIEKLNKNK